jgi:CHAT domain-containing protein/Tfp pilus assembly protein PilF
VYLTTLCQKKVFKLLSLIFFQGIAIVCVGSFFSQTFAASNKQPRFSASAAQDQSSVLAGVYALEKGDFETAIIDLTNALKHDKANNAAASQFATLIHLSDAHQAIGESTIAIDHLQSALELAETNNNPYKVSIVENRLGTVYLRLGDYSQAKMYLKKVLQRAHQANNSPLEATVLNNLGIIQMSEGDLEQARYSFQKSVNFAELSASHALAGKVFSNLAKLKLLGETKKNAGFYLNKALKHIYQTGDSHEKAMQLLRIGRMTQTLSDSLTDESANWRKFSYQCFKDAEKIAIHINDQRSLSYAQGYLGQLYLIEHRWADALELTNQAIQSIQQLRAPELLYRWQWQKGRLLKQQGEIQQAISSYQQAAFTLKNLRQSFNTTIHTAKHFHQKIGDLYLELADLLLQSSDTLKDEQKIQNQYRAARNTIEDLKTAELQNYLQDDCVTRLQAKTTIVDTVSPRTAIVYPILLSDRVEILVSLRGKIKRFTIPVNKHTITHEVRSFRVSLENRTTREYLPHAQALYRWLIDPLQSALVENNIDTLVIVPGGALLTIPLAALHNGRHFLIEKYAVATTPSMDLTDPSPLTTPTINVLANGISEPVQGFPSLPYVKAELEAIEKIYNTRILMNRDFSLQRINKEFAKSPYNIVHFATHGQFDHDPKKSFILSFDKPIFADALEQFIASGRFRDNPVELLTLSACQTAAGDDRAALGLAAIAIKAGARSALATLWLINDQAASDLVAEFYRQLKSSSKAQALQKAQTHLIQHTAYQHPYFWSPFLLIGNWL